MPKPQITRCSGRTPKCDGCGAENSCCSITLAEFSIFLCAYCWRWLRDQK